MLGRGYGALPLDNVTEVLQRVDKCGLFFFSLPPFAGKSAVKPKSAVRCMASSTGTSGARPAGGKKPASASWTERSTAVPRPSPAPARGALESLTAATRDLGGTSCDPRRHLQSCV